MLQKFESVSIYRRPVKCGTCRSDAHETLPTSGYTTQKERNPQARSFC
ncbi:unknown [Prevotella sp. CAG:5226]|nr:unknown [Prevotella sp. CAG:5226]